MATTKRNQIRDWLEAEKKRLNTELEQLKTGRPIEERREGSPFGKREEEATEALELEKRLALENRLKNLVAEVARALKKLEDSSYGICDMCGKPIDPARMEALPQANLCLTCRQKSKYAQSQTHTT